MRRSDGSGTTFLFTDYLSIGESEWHLPRGTEAEWLKQLVGEQLVTVKTKRGFSRLEWQKLARAQ